MKVLRVKQELCSQCYACETICSTNFSKEQDRAKSAIKIRGLKPESGESQIICCNQCGECIAVCPTGALFRGKNGTVLLKKSECVGCLSCVGFCPESAMFRHQDLLEPFKCIVCGKCVEECPENAIYIEEI